MSPQGRRRPTGNWRRSGSWPPSPDRKSTRLNSSHTEIYTLSLHDALPILEVDTGDLTVASVYVPTGEAETDRQLEKERFMAAIARSEEHTSELQSHRDLHSFPTRRSSDLGGRHRRPDRRQRLCPHRGGGDRPATGEGAVHGRHR